MWPPGQHLSIDEGAIPFKGRVAFKCFNPSKPDKYHIKSFKVVGSSNNYCVVFDLYVGNQYEEKLSEFGVTHGRVMKLMADNVGKNHIMFMDNWYSSPYLFYNLRLEETRATGTCRPRKGFPPGFMKIKLPKKGDCYAATYADKMVSFRIHDRKVVTLMSTVYSTKEVLTGKKHWQTKEDTSKPELMNQYNKYRSGVDANDQLLKYTVFSRKTMKWWKKVAFRLLNLAMVNAYILYKEWLATNNVPRKKNLTHNDFRVQAIKQLLATVTNTVTNTMHTTIDTTEFSRLSGRHFITRIGNDERGRPISRICKVCSKGDKVLHDRSGAPPKKGGKYGKQTIYRCKQCKVELCVDGCFELYHTQKDYVKNIVDEAS